MSICSGLEAATVAWHPLGWIPAAFSEIETFPRAVLKHHYPDVPLHGDFTTIEEDDYGAIDLLVGGTPCQDHSIAGKRAGMDGKRGSLAFNYVDLAVAKRARWFLWENVPGVFSVGGGRDFKKFLHYITERGYGFAYRILDAQYFGVPQRRRRVFVVGYLGDWRPAAAVLFEREGLRRDITPRREKGEEIAGTLSTGAAGGSRGLGTDEATSGYCQPVKWPADITPTLDAHYGDKMGLENQHINGGGDLFVAGNKSPVAFKMRGGCDGGGKGYLGREDAAFTVSTGQDQNLFHNMAVRRLTPRECERLQGFPDNYTAIPGRKSHVRPEKQDDDYIKYLARSGWKSYEECIRLAADGPRYKALGNSVAVPVMRWIGERIQTVDMMIKQR